MVLRRRRRAARTETATLQLYYASDVHGSDVCWRKFLGAGRFYGVQALIMGGDLTGKAIVPITVDGDAFRDGVQQRGLAGAGGRHDERALSVADGSDEVDRAAVATTESLFRSPACRARCGGTNASPDSAR